MYDFCLYYERSYVYKFHSATFMLQNILNTCRAAILKHLLYWYVSIYPVSGDWRQNART